MIAYFDTSALLPLIVEESGSDAATRLWDAASRAVSVRLAYPEARAALAQACRAGRLTRAQHRNAVRQLDGYFTEIDIVEIDAALARSAGNIAEALALRGYDAVHLAAAKRVLDGDLVFVAGDRALLAAAAAEGMTVAAVG